MISLKVTLISVAVTAMLSVMVTLSLNQWIEAEPLADHTTEPIYEFVHENHQLGNRYVLDVIKDRPAGKCVLLITRFRDLSVPEPVVVGFAATTESSCRVPQ